MEIISVFFSIDSGTVLRYSARRTGLCTVTYIYSDVFPAPFIPPFAQLFRRLLARSLVHPFMLPFQLILWLSGADAGRLFSDHHRVSAKS